MVRCFSQTLKNSLFFLPVPFAEGSSPPDTPSIIDPSLPVACEPDIQPSKLFKGKAEKCGGFITKL